ncbi:hypothetical protein [Brevundimonas lenta]|uniref:Uncharacterized protein n=1 Tax=Brevundimonas lenta TaxID=424796 RepID=A0A7W6JE48_9CAUL|nr:hypothetical protein [Brevundimonas lenta]MBB4083459.1 hypothetical protein [Brevundimonas lenta]
MIDSTLSPAGFAATALVAILAFLKGDEPERIGAGACLLALFTTLLLRGGPPAQLVMDLILLAIFAGLAWKSRRTWLLWACGLQAVIVMGRTFTVLGPQPPQDALNLAVWGVVLTLVVATVLAWRDRRAAGPGRSD